MATIEEIARLSGLSRSTVSRVLNDDARVSDAARERVMEIVRRERYQPNQAARGLASGRTGIIGTVIPVQLGTVFTDPYFPMLLQGISAASGQLGRLMLLWIAEPEDEERMMHGILRPGVVDGMIIASHVIEDRFLEAVAESGKPYVLVGRHPVESVSYVDVDNFGAARTATMHLARLGHRRIGTITGPQNMIAGLDRYQGYVEGLRGSGLALDRELVAAGDFGEESGHRAMHRLLERGVDAVFAANDTMALGALRAADERGARVPDDVALVGFDDIPAAARAQPPLTTVRQPIRHTGEAAVRLLLDLIADPSRAPQREFLPTELVVRASCGSARRTGPVSITSEEVSDE